MVEKIVNNIIFQPQKNYYNFMVDRRNLFDQPIKNNLKTNDNIRKIATG